MTIFDPIGTFAGAFKPADGGYIYYPYAKAGGKFVTAEEFDDLLGKWRRVAGLSGLVKCVGVVVLAQFVWSAIDVQFSLPQWTTNLALTLIPLVMISWLLWASLAPKRLLRDRPVIAPPRPLGQAQREARLEMNWRFVAFGLLISGGAFLSPLRSSDRSVGSWAWILGGGIGFVLYFWIGIQKLRDGSLK